MRRKAAKHSKCHKASAVKEFSFFAANISSGSCSLKKSLQATAQSQLQSLLLQLLLPLPLPLPRSLSPATGSTPKSRKAFAIQLIKLSPRMPAAMPTSMSTSLPALFSVRTSGEQHLAKKHTHSAKRQQKIKTKMKKRFQCAAVVVAVGALR